MSARSSRGLFITFEGVEGCGKSTQARALEERLADMGVSVVRTREPGGTPLGERLRDILLDRAEAGMSAETELFLYLASRAEHVRNVIVPAIARGAVVIADRFGDASVAYQGGGRELGAGLVRDLNQVATLGVKPDVTFLLDLDPAAGLERLTSAGDERPADPDRIESEEIEFHRRVREAYLAAAELEPERFLVLDAGGDRSAIADAIWERVARLLGNASGSRPSGRHDQEG